MIAHLFKVFFPRYATMFVGTGDVPGVLRFYERCGFRPSHREKDFFLLNYREPIVEEGVRLVDLVYLRADRQV